MCGIVGLVGHESATAADMATVERMNATLLHRGPDDSGLANLGQAVFAMRRLRVIDLEGGRQPLGNETGTIHTVFNGEIYNFADLRSQLQAAGHHFATHSDTEVLVHGYEEWGDELVTHLNGMFAFAIWDAPQRRLLLARDRCGEKPLFFTATPRGLYFASELKALLAAGLPSRLRSEALWHYLSLQYVPAPLSMLEGIDKLPPAHVLVWQEGRLHQRCYWTWDLHPGSDKYTDGEWIERTRAAVTTAVQRRLVADVPVGVLLSGGVDSSIVVAAASAVGSSPQASPSAQVRTFSIGFAEKAFDERPFARRIAQQFATEHHEQEVGFGDLPALLPELVWTLDEPLADASAVPVYHLAKLTRQHVTVALGGDGGDEVFGGYTRYQLDRALAWYRLLPPWLRLRVVPWLAQQLPVRAGVPVETNTAAGVRRLAQASSTSPKASILAWGSYFSDPAKSTLLEPAVAQAASQSSAEWLANVWDTALATTPYERTAAVDLQTYLPGDVLMKVDRMTMAHSLEARSPFLDPDVLSLAGAMPPRLKLRGFTQKWVLRQAFAKVLPAENVRRLKRGFGIPVGAWLRGPLADLTRDLLTDRTSRQRGLFQAGTIARLLEEHQQEREDHGPRLWALLIFELWARRFLD